MAENVETPVAERVALRDGSEIRVRPISPDDKAKLLEGFKRLSAQSRYRRFLTPTNRLSARMLRYLTEVDHHDHEALIAESAEGLDPVGVARYVRLADDPKVAEVAVTVVDDWQGRGVATELLRRLEARAIEEGIERVAATALADNREVLELLEDIGPVTMRRTEGGIVDIEIELPASGVPESPLRAALRRAASGALQFVHPSAGERESAPNYGPGAAVRPDDRDPRGT